MQILNTSTLVNEFENLDLVGLVETIKSNKADILELAPDFESDITKLIKAIEDRNATQSFKIVCGMDDSVGILDSLDISDLESDKVGQLCEFFELSTIYNIFAEVAFDHGDDAESIVLINESYFLEYIKNKEIELGYIEDHLIGYMNWDHYSDNCRIDYKEYRVDAPNTLSLDGVNFYTRA